MCVKQVNFSIPVNSLEKIANSEPFRHNIAIGRPLAEYGMLLDNIIIISGEDMF
jgi:hypothetical protein